ncbi:hypothetical protein CFHF_03030 [Caulobacter flavus]|jgi:hypothetical protein|uniref:Uncharacterized protein n=1 Tax=Caulobacter flavus TaxID=1679497 RepID=A0A2N5CYV3_9CAUL|nr:hypothetical protein [Caulobacter flavus]AYV45323.1 hypothetical protein C1707_03145 [Caulobacter flavus]PLR18998.1 hypothetical protein CFHF_03030 [Caulobacter flavus]
MSKTTRAVVAAVAGLSVLATSLAAAAQPRDLIGARAGQGENSLRSRGYQLDHTDGGVQYWWHPRDRECINLFVDDGRYDTIDRRPASECNAGKSGKKDNTGAIVAGALAIGILAAAAASSKKKHEDDRYRDDDDRRRDPPYSPARGVDCYPSQRACYERGRGYSPSWTSREFGYRY